jgi:hypothetical protein
MTDMTRRQRRSVRLVILADLIIRVVRHARRFEVPLTEEVAQ